MRGCAAICCPSTVIHRPPVGTWILYLPRCNVAWAAGRRLSHHLSPVSMVRVEFRPAVKETWYWAFMCARGTLVTGNLAAGVGEGLLQGASLASSGGYRLDSASALLPPVFAPVRVLPRGAQLGSRRLQLHRNRIRFSPRLRVATAAGSSSMFLRTLSAAFVVPHIVHDPVDQGLHGILSSRGHPVRGVS